ncbi:MAG: hypothetical protein ACRYG7_13225 [Janthinobacterium lividum]
MAAIDELGKRLTTLENLFKALFGADGKTINPALIPFALPGTPDYVNAVNAVQAALGTAVAPQGDAVATDNLLLPATVQAMAVGVSGRQAVTQAVELATGSYLFTGDSTKPTGGGVAVKFLKAPNGADLSNSAKLVEGANSITLIVNQGGTFPFVMAGNDGAAQVSKPFLKRIS